MISNATIKMTEEEKVSKMSLFDLPIEIIQHIVSFVTLQDVCRLGATCHAGYSVTHDEQVWSLHLVREYGVTYTGDLANIEEGVTDQLGGVVHDPTLQGNREMSIIYSSQFKRIMIDRNQSRQIQDPLRSILENSIGDILPKLMAFYVNIPAEEQCSARLVLFGPGIESENTKLLVHKIVNARSSTFDAVEFIKGLPGGIGSGVRINYQHMYNFDLMCLYSNFEAAREEVLRERGYSARLDPALNKILSREVGGKLVIQPAIGKLIPTIHGLVFAIDITTKSELDEDDLNVMRQELGVIMESQEKFNTPTPILVLACYNLTRAKCWTLSEIVTGLRLRTLSRPWGVFHVCCDNMRGVEKGLDWVLHHLSKRRKEWQYHMKQGQS